jgi:hypothetical protein
MLIRFGVVLDRRAAGCKVGGWGFGGRLTPESDARPQMTERFQREVGIICEDGTRLSGTILAEEIADGLRSRYFVEIECDQKIVRGESDRGFFDALCNARLVLESEGVLLCCNGASEEVYPSPMIESMGPAILAYRTTIGRQALRKDLVNIFDSDNSAKPASVEQQRLFHQKWLESLGPGK